MEDYIVKKPVEIGGRMRKAGESVSLTSRQALYLVLSGKVKKAPKKPAAKPAPKSERTPVSKPVPATSKPLNKEKSDA